MEIKIGNEVEYWINGKDDTRKAKIIEIDGYWLILDDGFKVRNDNLKRIIK